MHVITKQITLNQSQHAVNLTKWLAVRTEQTSQSLATGLACAQQMNRASGMTWMSLLHLGKTEAVGTKYNLQNGNFKLQNKYINLHEIKYVNM